MNTVAEASSGAIYAGGEFTMIAGLSQRYLARFDSTLVLDATFRPVLDGQVYAIVPQADGRVVIGGSFGSVNGVSRKLIARLNPDGSLDESFDPVFSGSEVRAFAVQSDGKILVAGIFWIVDGVAHSGVVRLTADGGLDGTFVAPSEIGSTVSALALQADGKVLVGGSFSAAALGNRLTRLNSDGSVDSSFATGSGANSDVNAIVYQPDGKIVVGGWFTAFAGTAVGHIVRLEPSGTIDATFAPGSGLNSTVYGLANLPDGRIGVGGYFNTVDGTYQYGFAVLTATGARDAAFAVGANLSNSVNTLALVSGGRLLVGGRFTSEGGVATSGLVAYSSTGTTVARTAAGFRALGRVTTAIPVRDNKWVVGGYFSHVNGVPRASLVRLNADGTVDESFDAGSLLYNDVQSLVEQGDGKLLVASWQNTYGHLLRLNADGSRDETFLIGTGFNQPPMRLALLPDGRIAAAGYFTTFAGSPCGGVVLLGRDGSRDSTFVSGAGFDSTSYSLVVQPDGRLIIGGSFTHYNGGDVGRIVRLNPDGTLHASMGVSDGPDGVVYALALQPDGCALLGGNFVSLGGATHLYRARLTPDFTVDSTYGSDPSASSSGAVLSALTDGRAWTTDSRYVSNCFTVQRLGRLTPTGSMDPDLRTFDLSSTSPSGIQQADDGRLLLVGASARRGGLVQNGLVMLKPDVSPLPQILSTVGGGAVQLGDSVTLSVIATGEGPLTYIWRHDGVLIEDADGASLTIAEMENASAGTYSVEGEQHVWLGRNEHGSLAAAISVHRHAAARYVHRPRGFDFAQGNSDGERSADLSVVPWRERRHDRSGHFGP